MTTATDEDAYLLALAGVTPEPEAPTVTVEVTGEHDAALADILAKCKGVRATGETLVDAYVDAFWKLSKLTKIEAARAGLDSASVHNKALWSNTIQPLRERMKNAVRAHCRSQAHVATKIADKGGKPKRSPEVDAFLLKHADDPTAQALAELLGL